MDTSSSAYQVYVASSALFALQTEVTDGVIWSYSFARMISARRKTTQSGELLA